jgi:hypothetical protein
MPEFKKQPVIPPLFSPKMDDPNITPTKIAISNENEFAEN